jgi:hypothetical protein
MLADCSLRANLARSPLQHYRRCDTGIVQSEDPFIPAMSLTDLPDDMQLLRGHR